MLKREICLYHTDQTPDIGACGRTWSEPAIPQHPSGFKKLKVKNTFLWCLYSFEEFTADELLCNWVRLPCQAYSEVQNQRTALFHCISMSPGTKMSIKRFKRESLGPTLHHSRAYLGILSGSFPEGKEAGGVGTKEGSVWKKRIQTGSKAIKWNVYSSIRGRKHFWTTCGTFEGSLCRPLRFNKSSKRYYIRVWDTTV